MPTLRERPSRGEISPAKKGSPTTSRSTPRSHRNSMAADAIEVRESIEAKGDAVDVEMEDADGSAPRGTEDADADAGADADADADADMDAEGEVDADGEPDDDDDGDPMQQDESDSSRDMLQLIRETSEYLCRYTIKVDGECVFASLQSLGIKMRQNANIWIFCVCC